MNDANSGPASDAPAPPHMKPWNHSDPSRPAVWIPGGGPCICTYCKAKRMGAPIPQQLAASPAQEATPPRETDRCSRCGKDLGKRHNWDAKFTSGYYVVAGEYWGRFARPGELFVCDACMMADPSFDYEQRTAHGVPMPSPAVELAILTHALVERPATESFDYARARVALFRVTAALNHRAAPTPEASAPTMAERQAHHARVNPDGEDREGYRPDNEDAAAAPAREASSAPGEPTVAEWIAGIFGDLRDEATLPEWSASLFADILAAVERLEGQAATVAALTADRARLVDAAQRFVDVAGAETYWTDEVAKAYDALRGALTAERGARGQEQQNSQQD